MRELELEGGKYRIVREDNGYVAAFRYGEAWRDLTGDKLIGALVSEVEELRQITPADGCVVQQADAWQAVIALLRESGAINPRTQRNTGKETALAAIRDLVEAARQPAGEPRAVELACDHDGWKIEPWDAFGLPIVGKKVTIYAAPVDLAAVIASLRKAEALLAKSNKLNRDVVLGHAIKPFVAALIGSEGAGNG